MTPSLYAQLNVAEQPIEFDIDKQPLNTALIAFSEQSGLNILSDAKLLANYQANTLVGKHDRADALTLLLTDTDLSFSIVDQQTVVIQKRVKSAKPPVKNTEKRKPNRALLEEVYVSASRGKDQIIDLPLAVSMVEGNVFFSNQFSTLADINQSIPGLELVSDGVQSAVLLQLRGVATTNITEIADGPVAVHVDNIYSPRSQALSGLLHDIDRVEVLRGPQGTLFGRNALAGTINIFTNKASTKERFAKLSLGLGNYGAKSSQAVLNTPLSESLALRLAYATDYHDAYIDVIDNYAGLGPHYPQTEEAILPFQRSRDLGQSGLSITDKESIRLSMSWQPDSNTEAFLSIERFVDNGVSGAELDPTLVNAGRRAVVLDTKPFIDLQHDSVRLELSKRFQNALEVNYYAAYGNMMRQQSYDADLGRDGSFESRRTDSSHFRSFSHELLLKTPEDQTMHFLGGLFFSAEDNDIVFTVDQQNPGGRYEPTSVPSWISEQAGAGVSFAIQPKRQVTSKGFFGHIDILLSNESRLKFGLRHTIDTKQDTGGRRILCSIPSVAGPYQLVSSLETSGPTAAQIFIDDSTATAIANQQPTNTGSNIGIADQPCWVQQVNDVAVTWENTSGLISLDHNLSQNSFIYGSVSTGFKSGHIQDAGNTAKPETVVNYELGYKYEKLANFRVSAAAYFASYKNLQYSNEDRFDFNGDGIQDAGGATIVRNASQADVKGFELEGIWSFAESQSLQLVANLVDAKFRQFDIPDTLYGDLFNPFSHSESTSNNDPVNLSGNRPPRTPPWRFTLSYNYAFSNRFDGLSAQLSGIFSDSYYLDIYNRDEVAPGIFEQLPDGGSDLGVQNRYQRFDLSFQYARENAHWQISAYIKNLTDEPIKLSSGGFISENGFVATYDAPRTCGLTLSYLFK